MTPTAQIERGPTRPVALRRDPDLHAAARGRTVRVCTVYGRESVFTDESNVVIGDLAGAVVRGVQRWEPRFRAESEEG